jgi:hypothetical protein
MASLVSLIDPNDSSVIAFVSATGRTYAEHLLTRIQSYSLCRPVTNNPDGSRTTTSVYTYGDGDVVTKVKTTSAEEVQYNQRCRLVPKVLDGSIDPRKDWTQEMHDSYRSDKEKDINALFDFNKPYRFTFDDYKRDMFHNPSSLNHHGNFGLQYKRADFYHISFTKVCKMLDIDVNNPISGDTGSNGLLFTNGKIRFNVRADVVERSFSHYMSMEASTKALFVKAAGLIYEAGAGGEAQVRGLCGYPTAPLSPAPTWWKVAQCMDELDIDQDLQSRVQKQYEDVLDFVDPDFDVALALKQVMKGALEDIAENGFTQTSKKRKH